MANNLMDQALRIHMVPAADVAAVCRFYLDGLGWSTWGPYMLVSFMLLVGTVMIVFLNQDYLAGESGIDFSATARAINAVFVETNAVVDAQLAGAVALGAELNRPARDRDGGLWWPDPENAQIQTTGVS